MIFLVLFLLLVGAIAVWGLISPASLWRVTQGWQYQHPRTTELSNAAYTVQRVVSLVVLGAVLLALFSL